MSMNFDIDHFTDDEQNILKSIRSLPDDRQVAIIRAVALERNRVTEENTESNLGIIVNDMLHKMSICSNIKGFNYIKTAIVMCVNDDSLLHVLVKVLYPDIAKKYGTTSSSVERAIRHAVAKSWSNVDDELINNIFGHTVNLKKDIPTNSEFITLMVEHIKSTYCL